ncbi:unnamed protein product [Arabis nemorensis]|uniref:Uncharacterized protein n=1 Tax=Arabis nemorensis TaxID=586526 RepID=A0A565B3L2_9BRAS|nr:unnamed protein product [Arabis nemorensis]
MSGRFQLRNGCTGDLSCSSWEQRISKALKTRNSSLLCHKSVCIVDTVLGDVSIFLVGKDEYDELAWTSGEHGHIPDQAAHKIETSY